MFEPANDPAVIWSLCLASVPVKPDGLWTSWSIAPAVILPLIAFAIVYAIGFARMQESAVPISRFHIIATSAGLGLLVLALVSPLCRLAATLAWGHMLQHIILVAIAPPLVVLGSPARTLHAAVRGGDSIRRDPAIANWRQPMIATPVYGLLIWLWHIPAFYEAALTNAMLHLVYLSSLLLVSHWFWGMVVTSPKQAFGAIALALFATMIHTGLLGALLTFVDRPLYPLMSTGAIVWGLSPIEDQQLAGLIMWVPMGAIYLIAGLIVIANGLDRQTTPLEPVLEGTLRR